MLLPRGPFSAEDEREMALRSTRLLGESGLSLSFDEDLHLDMVDALDDEDFDELILMAFRGIGKTTAISAWLARKIAKNRDFRCLVVSVEDEKASEIVDMTRKFLEMPQMVSWFGPFESRRLWSMNEFEVTGRTRPYREPTLSAAGIYNFRAGGHYNVIIKDDLLDDKNTKDAEKMMEVQRREALLVPMCDQGERLMVTAGTFWDDSDLNMTKIKTYGLMHEDRQEDGSLKRRIDNNSLSVTELGAGNPYKVRLFYKPIEDEFALPCFPRTHPREVIAKIKMTMRLTPEIYAAQYRLDPIPTENAKFRPEDFHFSDAVPRGTTGDLLIGGDFASSLKAGSDYTAFVVALITQDFKWYVLEAFREKLDSNEAIEKLFDLDRAYPGARFVLEQDRYVTGLMVALNERMHQRRKFLQIDYINAHARQKKESRIEAMQAIFRAGSVTFLTGRADILYDDLRRYPKAKKDAPDAMANIYEMAQSAPPQRTDEPQVNDDRFFEVGQVGRRSRLGETPDTLYAPARVKRMRAEEVPFRML